MKGKKMKKMILAAFAAFTLCALAEAQDATASVALSAPWETARKELAALFAPDPDVVVGDIAADADGVYSVTLGVAGADKADALMRIIEPEIAFGNVKLLVKVVPANGEPTPAETVRRAFLGNPAVRSFATAERGAYGTFAYVLFRKEVVQFFNDQLDDPNGFKSTLYADIARTYLRPLNGVYFATSPE